MNILVTGGAGFIGSHLVDLLVDSNSKDNIYVVDDLSGGFKENINSRSQFYLLDLRDKHKTYEVIRSIKPELVFHLAADATEGRSQFTPISSVERNYYAYLNLLVPAIKFGLKKIILISSMSVYGSQKPPFHEKLPRVPDDIYGITKTSMELSTEVLSKVHGFKYVIIRPHNVYGPRQNMSDPYRNVVAIFINRLLQNKYFYIYGDGSQKRAFTYIDDCVKYIWKSAKIKKAEQEIINIGPTIEYSINQLATIILNNFFGFGKIPSELLPKYSPSRPLEVQNAWCTVEKAERILGFKAETTLQMGVSKTIEWAKIVGPKKFQYIDSLELESGSVPRIWTDKLL